MNEAEPRLGDVLTTMKVQKAEFRHRHGAEERKVVDRKVTRRTGKMQRWTHRNVWC